MSFFNELKRRNVIRVGAAYIVSAWLVVQVVETLFPIYGLSDATARAVVNILAIGLIPVLILSWVFEWTPEGVKRDIEAETQVSSSFANAKRLDRIILVVLALALGYFAFDKFILEPGQRIEELTKARQEGRTEALVETFGDQSIAVLPFVNMSADPEQEFFSDGISEEILNVLARIPELRVISRSSSFAYKGQALEVPEIADLLKVANVLEGSVRRSGNTIRITAQLIEARSDTHLWSQSWDREFTDIFTIQDEIAAQVAEKLELTLLGLSEPESTIDPRAHELVLRGRHLLYQFNLDNANRAEAVFREAISIEPEYAPAHAGLAEAMRQGAGRGSRSREESSRIFDVAVETALALEPDNSQAMGLKGFQYAFWPELADMDSAREWWRKAIGANPSNTEAHRWLAVSYLEIEPAKSLELYRNAYSIDPVHPLINQIITSILSRFGRFDEAMEIASDYHQMNPDDWRPYIWASRILANQGRQADSLKVYYRAFQLDQEQMFYNWLMWHLIDFLSAPGELIATWLDYWKGIEGENYLVDGNDIGPEIAYLLLYGQPEQAAAEINFLMDSGRLSKTFGAYLLLRTKHDYQRARTLYESDPQFRRLAPGQLKFETATGIWDRWTDYFLILKHTGDVEEAQLMAEELLGHVVFLLDEGVVLGPGDNPLHFHQAQLLAILDRKEDALQALTDAVDTGYHVCGACLRVFPHYNLLRDEPEFDAIVARVESDNAAAVQRLRAEGLLLTPDQVLALDQFQFDPFNE